MTVYNEDLAQTERRLETNPKNGLSDREALKRLSVYGKNQIASKKNRSFLAKFADQFKDAMIIILIIAAAISFVVAWHSGDTTEFFEPVLIVAIIMLNALIGTLQESKAENALEALKRMSVPKARVIRGGTVKTVNSESVVPGDILAVEAGDWIAADARLIKSNGLKSEEAALTGESVPCDKNAAAKVSENAPIGDRHNMLHSGCSIIKGNGTAIVTATGMNTEMGKIAGLLSEQQNTSTPLQQKLEALGKDLGLIALAACATVFFIGAVNGMNLLEIFMIAISLAVSAIPEGLPAIVTVVLSIGVQKMVKKNAIIRKLPAVETLGGASVICSDKTGTLTMNKMTAVKVYSQATGAAERITSGNSSAARKLLEYAALCTDASMQTENKKEKFIGDPTETAIIAAAYENGIKKAAADEKYPRVSELPFDSERKLMTVVCRMDGRYIAICKGAFDVLKLRCKKVNISGAELCAEKMEKEALRVLAVAYKEVQSQKLTQDDERDFEFMGLVGMTDPPRTEAGEAVKVCREAGIKPIMITGDHAVTATAIAEQLGIVGGTEKTVTGEQLAKMDDEKLAECVDEISVYARVSPQDKLRIVKAWQSKGAVVAMTGDGVNDAPALKAADIGCAMGLNGTDVAKNASDMILTDDNFATIVHAVKEGRGIYNNIKKTISFLLATNTGEILTLFFAMLLWKKSPLMPMQLLWINLVTDSLPAIALGMEPLEADVMKRKPRPKDEHIFAGGLLFRILWQGFMFAGLTLTGYVIAGQMLGEQAATTVAFLILCMTQCFHAFNVRSEKSLFKIGAFKNKVLNFAAIVSFLLVALVTLVPSVAKVFDMTALPANMYALAVLLAFLPVIIVEIIKNIKK